jgi:glycosyltransferase A (GT-A) superfamily protein (DUF2064 family)
LRRSIEAVVRRLAWSTEAVSRQTIRKVDEVGLSVYEGYPWNDVDEPGDLARLREELGVPNSPPGSRTFWAVGC